MSFNLKRVLEILKNWLFFHLFLSFECDESMGLCGLNCSLMFGWCWYLFKELRLRHIFKYNSYRFLRSMVTHPIQVTSLLAYHTLFAGEGDLVRGRSVYLALLPSIKKQTTTLLGIIDQIKAPPPWRHMLEVEKVPSRAG